jgi:Fur family peroxide stress response transcriptional regulator
MKTNVATTEVSGTMRRPMKREALRGAFHSAGMRLTRQRLAIYRELESRRDHPDVEHLFAVVKPRIPQMSLFTVYRTMNALESAGMVRRVATWKGRARYDACVETHAHFLCETCGKIHDLETGDLGGLCHAVAGDIGTIRRMDVIFYGEEMACATTPAVAQQA